MLEEFFSYKNLLRMAIGSVVIFFALVISTGSVTAAAAMLLISIVCTAGVSLVIWLPIFWAAGLVFLSIVEAIMQPFSPSVQATPPIEREQISLVRYIRDSRVHGSSDSQIISRLREKGWTEAEIEQAFQSFPPPLSSDGAGS